MFGVSSDVVGRVHALPGVRTVVVEERGQAQVLVVGAESGAEVTPAVLSCLDGVRVGRVVTREPTLEDAYVELVGRRDRGATPGARSAWWMQLKIRSRSAFDGLLGAGVPALLRHHRSS